MIQRWSEYARVFNNPEQVSRILAELPPKLRESLVKEVGRITPRGIAEMDRRVTAFYAEYVEELERARWPEVIAADAD